MNEKSTLAILKDARALIAAGWAKESFESGGCYCTVGAVNTASGSRYASEKTSAGVAAINALAPFLPAYARSNVGQLYIWNDRQSRTISHVLAVFDKAIAAEELKAATPC